MMSFLWARKSPKLFTTLCWSGMARAHSKDLYLPEKVSVRPKVHCSNIICCHATRHGQFNGFVRCHSRKTQCKTVNGQICVKSNQYPLYSIAKLLSRMSFLCWSECERAFAQSPSSTIFSVQISTEGKKAIVVQ